MAKAVAHLEQDEKGTYLVYNIGVDLDRYVSVMYRDNKTSVMTNNDGTKIFDHNAKTYEGEVDEEKIIESIEKGGETHDNNSRGVCLRKNNAC